MIFHLFRPVPQPDNLASLYGMIVAQGREPAFYRSYGVPDTVNGRLEMIMLHVILLVRRLEREPAAVRSLGQGLFDAFCRDMDASLREMGVGDLAVPRKMREIGEAFYGRQAAYAAALAAPEDGPLSQALARNVFAAAADGAHRLAGYVREAERELAAQDGEAINRGELRFPDPEQVAIAV